MAAEEGVLTHIVIPEGLNQDGSLSAYFEGCVREVARRAKAGDTVYVAPGNSFGHARVEDEVAAERLLALRPDVRVRWADAGRERYLDTLDNATELRRWAEREGMWPLAPCVLYCNRFHVARVWFCFRLGGYRVHEVVGASPVERRGQIVRRLWYYDFAVANVIYEALALPYAALRRVGNA